MFSNEQKKIIKEAATKGPLTIKGFNIHGIPFVVTGQLADTKNSNCRTSISDNNISLIAHIPEDVPTNGYDQLYASNIHDSNNIYVEFFTIDPTKELDGSHLYIECIADCSGQIIYVDKNVESAKKNITDIRLSGDEVYFESEDEIDDVSKAVHNFIGQLVFLDDPHEKRRTIGVPISCIMFSTIAKSRIIIAKNNSVSFFQVSPSTKLYSLVNNETTLIAENNPEVIAQMQRKLSQKFISKKRNPTPKPKQPGSED